MKSNLKETLELFAARILLPKILAAKKNEITVLSDVDFIDFERSLRDFSQFQGNTLFHDIF